MKFKAKIVSGHGRGKFLGFPTFNLVIPESLTLLHGIYAGFVWIDATCYMGAIHFGPIPTFQSKEPTLEVFVLDYFDDRVVKQLEIEFHDHLREIMAFDSPEALHDQIAQDVERVREYLSAKL